MKITVIAVLCFFAVSCVTVVEYSPEKPRRGCYRSNASAPYEIVLVVGVNPSNPDEYMVIFEERHDKMFEGKEFNIPKSKVGFNCHNPKDTSFGFVGADQSGPPVKDDNGRRDQ